MCSCHKRGVVRHPDKGGGQGAVPQRRRSSQDAVGRRQEAALRRLRRCRRRGRTICSHRLARRYRATSSRMRASTASSTEMTPAHRSDTQIWPCCSGSHLAPIAICAVLVQHTATHTFPLTAPPFPVHPHDLPCPHLSPPPFSLATYPRPFVRSLGPCLTRGRRDFDCTTAVRLPAYLRNLSWSLGSAPSITSCFVLFLRRHRSSATRRTDSVRLIPALFVFGFVSISDRTVFGLGLLMHQLFPSSGGDVSLTRSVQLDSWASSS